MHPGRELRGQVGMNEKVRNTKPYLIGEVWDEEDLSVKSKELLLRNVGSQG